MRWLALILLIGLFAGGVATNFTANDFGYLLITVGNTSIETSLWIAILAVALLLLGLWILISVIGGLLRAPKKIATGVAVQRHKSRLRKLDNLLIAHLSGNYKSSMALQKGLTEAELTQSTKSALVIDCMIKQGQLDKAEQLLLKQQNTNPTGKKRELLAKLRLDLLVQQQKSEAIVADFSTLPVRLAKKPDWVLVHMRAAAKSEDWKLLYRLLVENRKQLAPKELWMALLEQAKTNPAISLDAVWKHFPVQLTQDVDCAQAFVNGLLESKRFATTQSFLLKNAIKPEFESLFSVVGDFEADKPNAFLEQLERQYKLHPGSQYLSLALGKLCFQMDLYGKAQDYLQPLAENDECDAELRNQALTTLNAVTMRTEFSLGLNNQAQTQTSDNQPNSALPE